MKKKRIIYKSGVSCTRQKEKSFLFDLCVEETQRRITKSQYLAKNNLGTPFQTTDLERDWGREFLHLRKS